ncbi:MAG TPA: SRPBCC family protein [Mariniphaga sp.]|nr:SRPBCC family protein [Mariniphaga sp.]
METVERTQIQIETTVRATAGKVWECFTEPRHIVNWNHASDDWHTTSAENDSKVGGRFDFRMEAKDGSTGFNFSGVNTRVEPYTHLNYTLDDGRKVTVDLNEMDGKTHIRQVFEAENTFSHEMQRQGWQSILNNFKNYVEQQSGLKKNRYEVFIKAKPEDVYRIMLDRQLYSEWTSAFNPNSRYEGSWDKGASIKFIGEDENGKKGGMISRIRENIPSKYVSIEHIGIFDDEKEITSGPQVEAWAGSLEDYYFREQDGGTLVQVELDVNDEYDGFFDETWPKALDKLKKLCENI